MYQQPNLIASQKTSSLFLPKLQQYRASGPIEEYTYDALKPKKKLKEIKKVLLPEKKKFIFRYGFKFNLKNLFFTLNKFLTMYVLRFSVILKIKKKRAFK